jgi:hypothetical protein
MKRERPEKISQTELRDFERRLARRTARVLFVLPTPLAVAGLIWSMVYNKANSAYLMLILASAFSVIFLGLAFLLLVHNKQLKARAAWIKLALLGIQMILAWSISFHSFTHQGKGVVVRDGLPGELGSPGSIHHIENGSPRRGASPHGGH